MLLPLILPNLQIFGNGHPPKSQSLKEGLWFLIQGKKASRSGGERHPITVSSSYSSWPKQDNRRLIYCPSSVIPEYKDYVCYEYRLAPKDTNTKRNEDTL